MNHHAYTQAVRSLLETSVRIGDAVV